MKTKKWIGIIFALLVILSGCAKFNNRGVIENPTYIARAESTSNLDLEKIELSDTATVLHFKAHLYSGWINIDKNGFLVDVHGNKYNLLSSEGLEIGQQYDISEPEEKDFILIFPPIPSNLTSIEYSEGDYDNAWRFWGIQLTNKPLKVSLPKGFKDVAIDKNAVLPPLEFKTGKARIEGQILNYCAGMPEKLLVSVAYPFDFVYITIPIDSLGKFSCEIDAYSTHPAIVDFIGNESRCFIAPDETTSLVLNIAEINRRKSRSKDKRPSLGEPVYYGGYLASLSKELANNKPELYSKRQYESYESYISFYKSIKTKTLEELKTIFLDEYQARKVVLDTLNVSPACKNIINYAIELSCISYIIDIESTLDRAYIIGNNLQNDREATTKYFATRKYNIPDNFYDVLKDFSLINDPNILYSQEAILYASEWQQQDKQPVLSKALGTDRGPLFEIMKISGMYDNIEEFTPVSEEEIEQLPVVFQEIIKNKNNEILQQIEINKNKTGYTVHDIEKVANKDVFSTIISKFKGKPILLDVWETWCGPCRRANEELKPLKEELADKGIVYVFVAGDSSPVGTWNNMITDLHGEHFRLTKEQRNFITVTYGIEGVPTYFFIDRKGNIKEKIIGYYGVEKMKESFLKLLDE